MCLSWATSGPLKGSSSFPSGMCGVIMSAVSVLPAADRQQSDWAQFGHTSFQPCVCRDSWHLKQTHNCPGGGSKSLHLTAQKSCLLCWEFLNWTVSVLHWIADSSSVLSDWWPNYMGMAFCYYLNVFFFQLCNTCYNTNSICGAQNYNYFLGKAPVCTETLSFQNEKVWPTLFKQWLCSSALNVYWNKTGCKRFTGVEKVAPATQTHAYNLS